MSSPVTVVPVESSKTDGSGVAEGTQNFSSNVANLWTQFSALSIAGKLVFLGFVVLIVAGIVLIIVLNITLHYPSGTASTCNLAYSWNKTGTSLVNDTQVDTPQAIYIKNNTIYISDAADTPIIHQMSTSGAGLTTFISSATMANPQAIYIDQSNNVFVSDFDNACVYRFNTTGTLITPTVAAGDSNNPGSGLDELDGPLHLAFNAAETYMFVADSNNDRVMRFSTSAPSGSDGVVVASGADSGISQPSGLYYDSVGDNLYITSGKLNIVIRWKPFASSGTVLTGISGTGGSSNSLLYSPISVVYDVTKKQLYVLDTGNARVMAYCEGNTEGTMIAGTGVTGVSSTKLSEPYDIGFDTNFNLYVMDSGNKRVQKYTRI